MTKPPAVMTGGDKWWQERLPPVTATAEIHFSFFPAAIITAFTTVGTTVGTEEANVITGSTAKNLDVQCCAALHANCLRIETAFTW